MKGAVLLEAGRRRRRPHPNAVLSVGSNESVKLGTGCKAAFFTSTFQHVEAMTNVQQVLSPTGGGPTFLHYDGSMSSMGVAPGLGYHTSPKEQYQPEHPAPITGGRYYHKKYVTRYKYELPDGPVGPELIDGFGRILIPVASLAIGTSSDTYAVTRSGCALAWGLNVYGDLGNGFSSSENWIASAKSAQYPQFTPGFVLTGPGPKLLNSFGAQEEGEGADGKGGGANVLKGVVAIAAGWRFASFLVGSGHVYLTGKPVGESQIRFATLDPVLEAAFGSLPGKPIAIAGANNGCLLLLEGGKVAYVGPDKNFMSGTEEHPGFGEPRFLTYPEEGEGGGPLENVTAVAVTESSCYVLKEGSVWGWGMNNLGQLGLGLPSHKLVVNAEGALEEARNYVQFPTRIQLDSEGHALDNVVAIHGHPYRTGGGSTGDDCFSMLLSDGTIRVCGGNYTYTGQGSATGAPTTAGWHGIGQIGDRSTENRATPINPGLSGVVFIAGGGETAMVIQEPGTPGVPTLQFSYEKGIFTAEWLTQEGTPGTLPLWREEQWWSVVLKEPSGTTGTLILTSFTGALANTVSGSNEVTGMIEAATGRIPVGTGIKGSGIPLGAVVIEVKPTALKLSVKATATKASVNLTPSLGKDVGKVGSSRWRSWSCPVTLAPGEYLVEIGGEQLRQVLLEQANGEGAHFTSAGDMRLRTALTTSGAITALSTEPIEAALASGAEVAVGATTTETIKGVLTSVTKRQVFVLTAPAAKGATSLAIQSIVPNFAYPEGSVVAGPNTVTATWGTPNPSEPSLIVEARRAGTYPGKSSASCATSGPILAGETVTVIEVEELEERIKGKVTLENEEGEQQTFVLTKVGNIGDNELRVSPAVATADFTEGASMREALGLSSALATAVNAGITITQIEIEAARENLPPGTLLTLQSPEREKTLITTAEVAKPAKSTISTAIVKGATVTTIAIEPAFRGFFGQITVENLAKETQVFTMTAPANGGDTVVHVESVVAAIEIPLLSHITPLTSIIQVEAAKPTTTYPIGSPVFGAVVTSARLTAPLSTASAITAISVEPLQVALAAESLITLNTKTFISVRLSSGLSEASAITSLPIEALESPLPSGALITFSVTTVEGETVTTKTQTFTTTAAAAAGATALAVASLKPEYPYVAGTLAQTATRLPSFRQTFRLKTRAEEGATKLVVEALKPNFAYPIGTLAFPAQRELWRRVAEVPGGATSVTFPMPESWRGVSGTINAHLSSALSTAAAITALPIDPLEAALPIGAEVTVMTPEGSTQTFVLSAAAVKGATTLAVNSLKPNFAYPEHTQIATNNLDIEVLVKGGFGGTFGRAATEGTTKTTGSFAGGALLHPGVRCAGTFTVS
jgi:hypothetical protein